MFAKIMKLKNRKTKGFTLVELIVVLIILGILAALLLPTLTGYIDKAHQEAAVAECRMGVMAAKTVGIQSYESAYPAAFSEPDPNLIKALAEYSGTQHFTATYADDATLTSFAYSNGTWCVTYTAANGYGEVTKGSTPGTDSTTKS